jgi:Amt family ammonium transporter
MSAVFIFCVLLAALAPAGLSLINTGLGRSRSASHAMAASLCAVAVAALAYFAVGFSWQGFAGLPSHAVHAGGKSWDWIAAVPFLLRRIQFDGSPASLSVFFGMMSAALAAMVPQGAGADRWRLASICASTSLLAGWTFPLFAHWVWGGGWLASLGANYGLGRGFLDLGGAGCIHVVGGFTALSISWILGPRQGKYSSSNMPNAIPGHNSTLVLFGCFLALIGFTALNSAGSILFAQTPLSGVPLVLINTLLSASASGLMALFITGVRFGRPDVSITANGWIGGLVAASAASVFLKPAEAVVVGGVAGALVTFSVEWFEFRMKTDDPGGAISAHGLAGIWGLLAAGLFASFPAASGSGDGQFLAQLVGVATLLGFVFPMTYGLNWILNRFFRQRVEDEGERQGMDLHELGADAYPEFAIHNEEFLQH